MLVLASGRGQRFGGPIPKVYLEIHGRTVMERTVQRLSTLVPEDQREIILAVHHADRPTLLAPLLDRLHRAGLTRTVDGGATRQASMAAALACSSGELILIHDAARPFFPVAATRQVLAVAASEGAALLALPVTDTLKEVDLDRRVLRSVDRSSLWAAQTPQVVRRDLLEQALRNAAASGFEGTDDSSLLEHLGVPVRVVESTSSNVKITRSEDLAFATWISQQESES